MHEHRHDERWERRLGRGWKHFEAMARRGFGGPGGGFGGPGGGWGSFGNWGGDNFRVGRLLASGDLRLVALYFIEQQPRHGYDLIKAIEEKTSGLYVPSPGVVYPALTFLEEASYVTSSTEGNKRLYTITDEGRAHLDDNREAVETTLAHLARLGERAQHLRQHWEESEHMRHEPRHGRRDRDLEGVTPEVNEARRALKHAIREASRQRDPASQERLAAILRRAADELAELAPPADPDADIDI